MVLIVSFFQALVIFTALKGQNAQNMCTPTQQGVTEEEQNEILKAHNEFRQKVANGQEPGQLGASNMNQLTWNSDLAAAAQRWADKCTSAREFPTGAEFRHPGQNVYTSSASNSNDVPSWKSVVQSWYDEVANFNKSSISKYVFDSNTEHYTQVVWATTKQVGCGYAFDGNSNNHYYVCDYGEGGNVVGYPMNSEGAACSECDGCSTDYPGLCSPEMHYGRRKETK